MKLGRTLDELGEMSREEFRSWVAWFKTTGLDPFQGGIKK